MNQSLFAFPSREEGLALHLHLCDLNPAAVADVLQAYLDPLLAWLAAKYAGIDPHFRQTAVHDALVTYVQSPQSYDPTRSDLAAYLRMAARWDLANLLKAESKHHQGRVAWAVVEEAVDGGNLFRGEDPSLQLERAEETQQWQAFLETLIDTFTEEERRVLHLMLAGERKTGVYAKALGLDDRPAPEQEREVKKVKDRIKKRLERGVQGHG
jgi:hypothetical protein